jgi:hypothetical protein
MANNKLILRTLTGWNIPYIDITKNSVLTHADVDNNFIYLKGEVIYSAHTSGDNLILNKVNGSTLTVDLTTSGTSVYEFQTGTTKSVRLIDGIGNNTVENTSWSNIQGGSGNTIVSSTDYSSIVGGQGNYLAGAGHSFMGGGANNNMYLRGGSGNVMVGGTSNYMGLANEHGFIGGGHSNSMTDSHYSVIGGGSGNTLQVNATHSFIGGGLNNYNNGNLASIVGGQSNQILRGGINSVIVGGSGNTIPSSVSSGTRAFIGAGFGNSIIGQNAVIGGGFENTINQPEVGEPGDTSINSFIGAGYQNTIYGSAGSVIGGGSNNYIHEHESSFIGAGKGNNISGASGELIIQHLPPIRSLVVVMVIKLMQTLHLLGPLQ